MKYCEICGEEFSTMYRIQYQQPKAWVFVCEDCLLQVKKDNPDYRYGGTWKK
jgi:ribosome-binding protein aMBF1 (putative translation factor)